MISNIRSNGRQQNKCGYCYSIQVRVNNRRRKTVVWDDEKNQETKNNKTSKYTSTQSQTRKISWQRVNETEIFDNSRTSETPNSERCITSVLLPYA